MQAMRIRRNQHPILHGIAFTITGGASAPVSAAMMGTKAHRNHLADEEMKYYFGGGQDGQVSASKPSAGREPVLVDYAQRANARKRGRYARKHPDHVAAAIAAVREEPDGAVYRRIVATTGLTLDKNHMLQRIARDAIARGEL
jgi:hypothetical protein